MRRLRFQSLLHQGISLLIQEQLLHCFINRSLFQSLLHQGISLLDEAALWPRGANGCFNPFFIRASVYCVPLTNEQRHKVLPFQSLLHQGISLLRLGGHRSLVAQDAVSIPSSSGHQFTDRGIERRQQNACALFQSLLHQGISLLASRHYASAGAYCFRFNPFFIRASVY